MAAAAAKTLVLITGGNSGIGFELAAQLAALKTYHVIIGSRSAQKGEAALQDLQSRVPDGSVELVELDVSKKDSINAAAAKVSGSHGRLDALVNNAAVAVFPDGTPIEEQMASAFATNAIGPWLMVEAFAPLLKKSNTTPRIVNVSSGAGSITLKLDLTSAYRKAGHVQYRTSKAALNMVTACQVTDYEDLGWKIFTYCPGHTVSNLGPTNKAENGAKPTSEGTRPILDLLNGKRDEDQSKFIHYGGYYPW